MADPSNDPMALWRDMLGQWEKSVNALANQTMGTDEGSRSINSAMGLTLKMHETMRDAMATHLANMNLPSRADVARIDERLQAVEGRLDRIVGLLERIAAGGAGTPPVPPPRPPRTKRPPGAAPA